MREDLKSILDEFNSVCCEVKNEQDINDVRVKF